MNKLIHANYWFGCDWWFYEVGYLGMHAGQLLLACAVVYPWNTGHFWVTRPWMNSGFQHNHRLAPHGGEVSASSDPSEDIISSGSSL